MKAILNVLGGICIVLGAFLFSQGMRIIKIGFVAGHRRWIAIGAVLIIGGVFPLIFANRHKIIKSKS
jgi:uncharacterized membrane protein YozB (DUF420 family)